MLIVKWHGRFGNQLFQYCFGRILNLETGRYVSFPRAFTYDLSGSLRHTDFWKPESPGGKKGSAMLAALARFNFARKETGPHLFDRSVLNSGDPVILSGFYQRYEYYRPYKEEIRRQWLPLPNLDRFGTHPEDIYVHIRRTDYLELSFKSRVRATPAAAFERAIETFPSRRNVFILTDAAADPFHETFRHKFRAKMLSTTLSDDFLRLAAARRVVMSQSSFSWWATFLGRAERVICPIDRLGTWASTLPAEVSLRVDDEPRFEYPGYE